MNLDELYRHLNLSEKSVESFIGSDGRFHFVYITVNKLDNKYYIGKHSTNRLKDKYLGSNKYLKNSIRKYGEENFSRVEIKFFNTYKEAFQYEIEVLTEEIVLSGHCYNVSGGGEGWGSGENNYASLAAKHGLHYMQINKRPVMMHPWRHNLSNKDSQNTWKLSLEIKSILEKNPKLTYGRLCKVLGTSSNRSMRSVMSKLKSGWNPVDDSDWLDWITSHG